MGCWSLLENICQVQSNAGELAVVYKSPRGGTYDTMCQKDLSKQIKFQTPESDQFFDLINLI